MVVRASITRLILLMGICITAMVIYLPTISAYTFTCYFEDWQGIQQKCSDRTLGDVWPYKIDEDKDFYYITRLDETLPPIPKEGTHTFKPNYVGWNFEIQKDTPNSIRNSISTKLLPETNLKHFTYVQPTVRDSNGSVIDIYNNTQLLSKNTTWPLIVEDPWVINPTEGWNGTFTQTNLDENESLRINQDLSLPLFQEAISYWTMDRNLNNDGFNSTHIFDFNETSSNNGTIVGATDSVGWINRSRSFDGVNDIVATTVSVNNNLSYTNSLWFKPNIDGGNIRYIFYPSNVNVGPRCYYTSTQMKCIQKNATGTDKYSPDLDQGGLVEGKWYHFVLVFDSTKSNFSFYMDSVFVDSYVVTGIYNATSGNFQLGRTSSSMNGSIDEVGIWNRALTPTEIQSIYNGSFYSSGNFTTDERDAGAGNIANNISATFTLEGSSSINLYLNSSIDSWATNTLELLCTGCTSATNYTPLSTGQDYRVIAELINGSTPHVSEIEITESPDTTPPNITSQLPANESNFNQEGETVNIPLSVTCTDNVMCDNATLHIYNSTFDEITFVEIHFTKQYIPINVTGTTGTVDDLREDDGNYLDIQELGPASPAANCMDAFFNYTNVPTDHNHQIVIDGRYTGGAAHFTNFGWRNYSAAGEVYVSFANFTKTAQDQSFTSIEINSSDMVDTNGNATIKITHDDGSCVAGHHMLIDQLFLIATNNNKDFTDGFLNFTVPLSAADDTRYHFFFEAWDTSGNYDAFEFNYTFTITATGPNASNIIIIQPFNITYEAINIIPIRGYIINEAELDTIWYSINGTANVTLDFNTSTAILPNGENFNITVCINRTNGLENCTTRYFAVDYDGLYWEYLEEGDGTGMQTVIYLFYLTVAFLSGLYAMNRKEPITMFLSAMFFILASVECINVTILSAGTEFTYVYQNYIYLWGGFAIVAVVLTVLFVLDQEGFKPA